MLTNTIDLAPIIISLKTSISAIFITIILGIILASLVLKIKNNSIKTLCDTIITFPLVLPPTVTGFILLMIFGSEQLVGSFFIRVFNYQILFSWSATVIAAVVVSLPIMYQATLSSLAQIDQDCISCAKTLGLSNKKIFYKIKLPLAKNGLISGAILAYARGLGEFGATSMIAGNIKNQTQTLPLVIYSKVMANQYQEALAYVVILIIISFIIIYLSNLYNKKRGI